MRAFGRRVLIAAFAVALIPLAAAPASAAPTVERRAGGDRYGTAVEVSKAAFNPGVPVVYVATGTAFPDALAAGPAARAGGGPVLLTPRDTLPAITADELRRLQPGRIAVLGGSAAVSDGVVAQLRTFTAGEVRRIAGSDRYGTASAVSAAVFAVGPPVAYIATGTTFPDALAAGAAGAASGGPVLLVTPATIPAATAAELRRLQPRTIHVVGGPAAVSPDVEAQLRAFAPSVGRSGGADRYATSVAVSANTFGAPKPTVFVATGLTFPDAVAAAPAAGLAGGPVLLVPGTCVPEIVRAEIARLNPSTLVLLGGEAAVGPGVAAQAPCPSLATARVAITRIATLSRPTDLLGAPDGTLYVAEKGGRMVAIRGGTVDPTPVLDLTGEVSTGSEQGLLGFAFSADRSFLYVNYTDAAGDTHITEFPFRDGRADAAGRRDVMTVDQPFANHNGGAVVLGPDGKLWLGLGDGGGQGDPGNRAQDLGTVLGKILRIDPRGPIPSDNPFVGRAGARPEIWSYGLRNPWRLSFDRATGDLWIGDVGQAAWEEIDFATAGDRGGQNWGWKLMEGNHPYAGDVATANPVPPILEYSHDDGSCSITGGFVYRGSRIPGLTGAYVHGDFCRGRLLAAHQEGGRIVEQRDLGVAVPQLSSFGQDAAGELYALSLGGAVYRIDPA